MNSVFPPPPSKVLYLKNLSPRVDQADLVSIFTKYQQEDKPRIIYKLMQKGKMRGQAFVNFHCKVSLLYNQSEMKNRTLSSLSFLGSLTACRALEEMNGTILHGKPIIAQFSSSAIDKR